MKLNRLAMIAASGLMAASFVYVVPAYAEEFTGDEEVMAPQQLTLADNSSASAGLPSEVGGNDANKMGADTSSGADNSAQSGNAAAPANDQGTPDVASGDDDY